MALILEIRDRRGAVTWQPLDTLPLTIGRGLTNDVILDDPYVDAQHISIATDDSGALVVQDLGSVNGMRVDGARAKGWAIAVAGTELVVGRTRLRFRDRDEAVPAALSESGRALPRGVHWATTTIGSLTLLGLLILTAGVSSWADAVGRSKGSDIMAGIMAAVGLVVVWSTIWGVSARGPDRRVHWLAHVAVASAAFMVVSLYSLLNEWLVFLFPDADIVGIMFTVVMLAVLVTVIAAHLTVAGVSTRKRRWIAGFSVVGVFMALVGIGVLVDEEEFSAVPVFQGQLKSVSTTLVPTSTLEEFGEAIAEARSEADKAIAR